jgi:hypothetical protein
MNVIDVSNWEEFEAQLKELRAEYGKKVTSPLLYRGQGDSEWKLETTLERNCAFPMLFSAYYQLICGRMGPEVGTFGGVAVPEYASEVWRSFENPNLFELGGKFPDSSLYRYMAYLRHHGLPSPLLDWSKSAFIAAFFAYRESLPSVKRRAIYAYTEVSPDGFKVKWKNQKSLIYPLGGYVQAHHRHFRQQCNYTICALFDETYAQWRYDSHQRIFDSQESPNQDLVWKFTLPSSEREKVLRDLNEYNLNAFSLFGSDESLLETMWAREFLLRKDKLPGL